MALQDDRLLAFSSAGLRNGKTYDTAADDREGAIDVSHARAQPPEPGSHYNRFGLVIEPTLLAVFISVFSRLRAFR